MDGIQTEEDAKASCYLNDLEVLVLITPLSKKTRRRFFDLIDQLRAEIELRADFGKEQK